MTRIKTTKDKIANHWVNSELKPDEIDLNFDWSDAINHCWNCGKTTNSLQRCHIIPNALGGEDVPSNYVLLCYRCHLDSPDINDNNSMWNWIKSNKLPFAFSGTYSFQRALIQFKNTEGYSFLSLLDKRTDVNAILKHGVNKINDHCGHTSESTFYYMLKNISDKLKAEAKR